MRLTAYLEKRKRTSGVWMSFCDFFYFNLLTTRVIFAPRSLCPAKFCPFEICLSQINLSQICPS
jgi:hypothetical protein